MRERLELSCCKARGHSCGSYSQGPRTRCISYSRMQGGHGAIDWAHAAVSKMHAAYRGLCRRFLLRLDEMTVMTIASCASVHV